MDNHDDNIGILKKHVQDNQLQDSNSNIHFNYIFKIKTDDNYEKVNCEVMNFCI